MRERINIVVNSIDKKAFHLLLQQCDGFQVWASYNLFNPIDNSHE